MPSSKPLPVLLCFAGCLGGWLGLGCAGVRSPKPAPAEPAQPASRVEKFREPLAVTPLELHFSGLRGETKASESIAVKNEGNEPAQVSQILVVGPDAKTFRVFEVPPLPVTVQPGKSFSFSVGFEPTLAAEPRVHHARVRIVRSEDDDGPPCDLTGLVTRGTGARDEPPLQQVLEALGYDIDVGSTALKLPSGRTPIGDEIKAPLFVRAKPGTVGYYLVARYTSDEAFSFGYYLAKDKKPAGKLLGSAGSGSHQTLNPELDGESQTSFDPGEATFGLYLKTGKRTSYAEAKLNPGRARRARTFPLRSRGRTPVQDAYLLAFDEDGDGDFQDHVFMLWNAKPAGE